MFTLKITNSKGQIFELTHDLRNYAVIDVQGLTRPQAQINRTIAGTLDGSFYNSARVEERNIVLTVVLNGDIEANRQRLYNIFPIPRQKCDILWMSRNRNVTIEGYIEVLESNLFENRETVQISIICPRPYFQDAEAIFTELSEVVKMFEFPFAISEPIPFSEILDHSVATVNNIGDVVSGLKIAANITDNVTGLTIYNTTTSEYLGFDFTFASGDHIDISTMSGKLYARLLRAGQTVNLMKYLKSGSKWLKLALGENDFTYTATSGDDAVSITLETANLYGGI